jgi:hypothetical protein
MGCSLSKSTRKSGTLWYRPGIKSKRKKVFFFGTIFTDFFICIHSFKDERTNCLNAAKSDICNCLMQSTNEVGS